MYRERIIPLEQQLARKSVLLLGPRRVGKSSLIRHAFAHHRVYNLLHADVFTRLAARPALVRESLRPDDALIVIDEVQKLPNLLDEVHDMIEAHGVRFLLTGSSARKLRRTHTSLMAGRAKVMRLLPFVTAEVGAWDLERVLRLGLVPAVYEAADPVDELKSYVGDYLREEIQAEALARKVEAFSRFLHRAALSNTEVINFESIARDAQVPGRTIREYYKILEDTLVGTMLEPLRTTGRRKAIARGKFYFFDVGVANALTDSWELRRGTPARGKAFEQLIFQELHAYCTYAGAPDALRFWRTETQQEVDFVIADLLAVEVKASETVTGADLKGLRNLQQEQPIRRRILVSEDPYLRRVDDIELMPYNHFLAALWGHELVALT